MDLFRMKGGQLSVPAGWTSAICAIGFLIGACNVYAEPVTPRNDSPVRVNTLPSRLQCSPVTPDTKVPWIEVSQLPDVFKDSAYFEACSDLDSAWTIQSYPNPQYVPDRTPEHEARVSLLLQGIKDYVAAESDDWVAYVNAWLGVELPKAKVVVNPFPNGNKFLFADAEAKNQLSKQFHFKFSTMGWYGTQLVTLGGVINSSKRRMSISQIDSAHFCITPVDLQKAFENHPGYLFRPMSVRTSNRRPNAQELAEQGGQWFGYEVHMFDTPSTGGHSGLMMFGFGFKPCASRIQIDLKKTQLSTLNAKSK